MDFTFKWDSDKDNPPFPEMLKAVENITKSGKPHYYYSIYTYSDDQGALITDKKLNYEQAEKLFEQRQIKA